MGFLSFLSRRRRPVNEDHLKTQPYNVTTPHHAPVHGRLPAPGNGSGILETLHGHKRQYVLKKNLHHSQAQLQRPLTPTSLQDGIERPQTAPPNDEGRWPNSETVTDQSLPPLPSVTRPSSTVPLARPDGLRPPYRLPDKVYEPSGPRKALPVYPKEPAPSMRSNFSSSSRGFVDLLDAQAGLLPTDFHQRIHAAGARNYGEDVADRNVGENGVDVNSPESKAYYLGIMRPTSSMSQTLTVITEDGRLRPGKRHSLGVSLRTRSPASSIGRVALHTRAVSEEVPPLPETHRDHGDGLQAPFTNTDLGTPLSSRPSSSRSRHIHDQDYGHPESHSAERYHEMGHARPLSDRDGPTVPTSKFRTTMTSGSSIAGTRGQERGIANDATGSTLFVTAHTSEETKSSRDENVVHTPRARSGGSQGPANTLSSRGPRAFVDSETDQFEDDGDLRRLWSSRLGSNFSRHNLGSDIEIGDTLHGQLHLKAYYEPAAKALIKRPRTRDGTSLDHGTRTRSLTAMGGIDHRHFDFDVAVAERANTMRNWSMDSTSATSLSSKSYRPQSSRHTANTSIDLSPPVKEINLSSDSLSKISFHTAPEQQLNLRAAKTMIARPSRTNQAENFNIDDYISSDEDLNAPRDSPEGTEEHLLFNDTGYGLGGIDLPGISTQRYASSRLAPETPSAEHFNSKRKDHGSTPSQYRSSHSSHANEDSFFAEPRIESPTGRPRQRRVTYRHDSTDSESSDEDEQSDAALPFDIPRSRHLISARYYRPSRYASREEMIEEERDKRNVEISTAMRRRKEEKKRSRLSLGNPLAPRPRSTLGKDNQQVRTRRSNTTDFDADVE